MIEDLREEGRSALARDKLTISVIAGVEDEEKVSTTMQEWGRLLHDFEAMGVMIFTWYSNKRPKWSNFIRRRNHSRKNTSNFENFILEKKGKGVSQTPQERKKT